ncbi:MAG TPA: TonB-dependent receptor [Chitinophagaceae bacterium]|nr:TonB-dependent receptor [Chitinophagaceae bacterium]
MKRILFVAACLLGIIAAQAQTTITGKITDASTGAALPGATISFAGKGGTTSDKEGNFSIPCGKATRIIISFIGYTSHEVIVKNCNDEIRVALVPASKTLNDVEIAATSNPNKSVLYQPVSITKLSTLELKRGTGLFLDDAINANVPGVTMNRRTVSAGQQFNIRGYGNGVRGTNGVNSNFDGQGYKVYLNGIPVTDAEGVTLMDDIDFGSVGNVEVVKGPSGTLYGLAIAGVVNLTTIRPEKGKTSIGQDVMFGSNGLQRFTTHFQSGKEHSSFLLNYGYQHSDGFMSHSESTKRFFNASGDVDVNEKQTLRFYAGYSDSYDQRGGELTISQYANKDYTGNPAYIQRNAHSNIISVRLGIGHTYNFSSHVSNTTTVHGTGISNNVSSAAGWTDKDPINYGVRSTFDTRFGLKGGVTLNGITGVEAQQQRAQVIGYFMKADPANPTGYFKIDTMRSNQFYISGTKSLFTEWTLGLPGDLSITAGIGYSTMKIDLSDRFVRPNITRPMNYSKTYKDMWAPHLAVNKVFNKAVSVYASYSKGFKAPVAAYFFIPVSPSVGFINDNLKPEIGNQFEIGTKGSIMNDRLSYQIALFNAIFSDKMTPIAVPLNPPDVGTAYTYVGNGGKHNDKGVEVLLKYIAYQSDHGAFRAIRPWANVTYSDFKYEDYKQERLKSPATSDTTLDYSGNPVAGVAPWVANIGIDFMAAAGLYANIYYSYKDPMPFTSDNVNRTASYSLLNAKIGIQRSISNHFDIDAFFGINNITGVQYPYMVFINQLPDAYLPAPYKANYFGGVNLKFVF